MFGEREVVGGIGFHRKALSGGSLLFGMIRECAEKGWLNIEEF